MLAVVDWLFNALFWAFVGAVGTLVWFKATFSCVELVGTFACTPHHFNLLKAFI
jgi:hypothetical protein